MPSITSSDATPAVERLMAAYNECESCAAKLQIMHKGRISDRVGAAREYVRLVYRMSSDAEGMLGRSGVDVDGWRELADSLYDASIMHEGIDWSDIDINTSILVSRHALMTEYDEWLRPPQGVVQVSSADRRALHPPDGGQRYNAGYGADLLRVMNDTHIPTEVRSDASAAFSALVSPMSPAEELTLSTVWGVDVNGWRAVAAAVEAARQTRGTPFDWDVVPAATVQSFNTLVSQVVGELPPAAPVAPRVGLRGSGIWTRMGLLTAGPDARPPSIERHRNGPAKPGWVAEVPDIGTIRGAATAMLDNALLKWKVTSSETAFEILIDGVRSRGCGVVSDAVWKYMDEPRIDEMTKSLEEALNREFHNIVKIEGICNERNHEFYDSLLMGSDPFGRPGSVLGRRVPLMEHQAGNTEWGAHTSLSSIDCMYNSLKETGDCDDAYLPCVGKGAVCGKRSDLGVVAVVPSALGAEDRSTKAAGVTIGVRIHVPALMWLRKPMFLAMDGKTPVTEMIWLRHPTGPMAGTLTGEWRDLETWKAEQGNEGKGCEHYVRDTAATNYIEAQEGVLAKITLTPACASRVIGQFLRAGLGQGVEEHAALARVRALMVAQCPVFGGSSRAAARAPGEANRAAAGDGQVPGPSGAAEALRVAEGEGGGSTNKRLSF